jgi:hypothetical protein
LKFNLPGIPPAVEHPLWDTWFANAFAQDRRPYGVHEYLHHYINSYDALMSILASQTLWASDIRCLQDTTEFEHGIPSWLYEIHASVCQLRDNSIRHRRTADSLLQGTRVKHHSLHFLYDDKPESSY